MNSINITGRITHDLELKVTQSNIHVLEFQLAIRDGKDKEGNEKTIFLRCQAWRQTADYLSEYAAKGSLLAINGSIKQDRYQKDGETVEKILVNVNSAEILSHRKEEVGKFGGDRSNLGSNILEPDDLPFY